VQGYSRAVLGRQMAIPRPRSESWSSSFVQTLGVLTTPQALKAMKRSWDELTGKPVRRVASDPG